MTEHSKQLDSLADERSAGPEAEVAPLFPDTSRRSSLDAPRQLTDQSTGFPSITSLFSDLCPIGEDMQGATVLYIHIPSSCIVEERFGWEALEAYRGLIATYLTGLGQALRRERAHCVVTRAFADDFVILASRREHDEQLPTRIADGITRHLSAVDEETAALLQVYVGIVQTWPFAKIHPERQLYRAIQQAQTEATDIVRQRLSHQLRILDRCISEERFVMLYQPILRVSDYTFFGYEALVRCQQPELKNPHVLFNVAEQGDRMQPLSRLLRRVAAAAVPDLPDDTRMFINLHAQDFDDPALQELAQELAPLAQRVVFEVTERAAILDLRRLREQLEQLRAMGYRIAIDDFGSGYSALGLVAELELDIIKLDMTLVRNINASPVRQNLVRTIVSFAQDLRAQVVAEGVETAEELQCITDLGCQLVQGYYLAMPSPPFMRSISPTIAEAQSVP